jgi:hypothetical protein
MHSPALPLKRPHAYSIALRLNRAPRTLAQRLEPQTRPMRP